MERDLVHARQAHEARRILGDQRMLGAQYRAERTHTLDASIEALLVEIVAEQIDAIRAGKIVERISVEEVVVIPDDDDRNAPTGKCRRAVRLN